MAVADAKATFSLVTQTADGFNVSLGYIKPKVALDIAQAEDSDTQKAAATLIDNFCRAILPITSGTYTKIKVVETFDIGTILAE